MIADDLINLSLSLGKAIEPTRTPFLCFKDLRCFLSSPSPFFQRTESLQLRAAFKAGSSRLQPGLVEAQRGGAELQLDQNESHFNLCHSTPQGWDLPSVLDVDTQRPRFGLEAGVAHHSGYNGLLLCRGEQIPGEPTQCHVLCWHP